jgi:hypothetical protein
VISRSDATQNAYIVHAPEGLNVWVVVSAVKGESVGRFPSLRAALTFVQSTTFGPAPTAPPSDADWPSGLEGEQGAVESAMAAGAVNQPPD